MASGCRSETGAPHLRPSTALHPKWRAIGTEAAPSATRPLGTASGQGELLGMPSPVLVSFRRMRRVSEDDRDRPPSPNRRPEAQRTPMFVMAGGSLALTAEAKRRKRKSVGVSVALQALLMGGMMAAVVVGPPAPRLRANPTPERILTYFVMPPPPVRERRARTQPTPLAATPAPALLAPRRAPRAENPPTPIRPPALLRERAAAAPARRPEPRPAPAPPSSAKPPTARIELGKFGAPRGLDPQPGAVVPAPTIGTFGAALHQD